MAFWACPRSLPELAVCVNELKRQGKEERKQSWMNPRDSDLHNRTDSGITNWDKALRRRHVPVWRGQAKMMS